MNAHAHPELVAIGPGVRLEDDLRIRGGAHGIHRTVEGEKEGVALGVDLVTAVPCGGLSQQAAVGVQCLAVALGAESSQQVSRPFDICEEEGYGACW